MTKEELEKENAELKRHIKADCVDCADYYKNKTLEKENAELKEDLETQKRINREMITPALDRVIKQLTKAKEIIRELLSSCFGYNSKTVNYEVKAKAEAFLKE